MHARGGTAKKWRHLQDLNLRTYHVIDFESIPLTTRARCRRAMGTVEWLHHTSDVRCGEREGRHHRDDSANDDVKQRLPHRRSAADHRTRAEAAKRECDTAAGEAGGGGRETGTQKKQKDGDTDRI